MKIKITWKLIKDTIITIFLIALLFDTLGWAGGIFNSINTDRYTYRSKYDGSIRTGTKKLFVDWDMPEW